jgi:protease YdgD
MFARRNLVRHLLLSTVVVMFGAVPLLGPAYFDAAHFGQKPFHLIGHQAKAMVADVNLRRTVDPGLRPYAAVGRFRGTMLCTAAIVGHPRIILTAGHCVTEKDGSVRKSNLSFQLGYEAGTARGHFEAMVWAIGSKQNIKRQTVHDASQDWAILVLDRTPTGVQPFVLGYRHSIATLKALQRQFFMPSYSHDIGDAEFLSVDPACSVRDLMWEVLIHDCSGTFGSSGAPLLIEDRLQYAVAGIHTGAMFASDDAGHIAKFVGNRAIGSWTFAPSLLALVPQLNAEASRGVESPAY